MESAVTVSLVPVGRDDQRPLFRLKVAADQERFFAPNEVALAQAPFAPGSTKFYQSLGFWRTGEIADGEVILSRPL